MFNFIFNWKNYFSVLVFAVMSLSSSAYAASFDCRKASTVVEIMICGNQTLSGLDDQMFLTYKSLLSQATSPYLIKQDQIQWLSSKRNLCQNIPCLDQEYRSRISALTLAIQQGQPMQNSSSSRDTTGQHISDSLGQDIYNREILITNKSGASICKFFASRTDVGSWQEDILGIKILRSGYDVTVNIDDGSGACVYDFKTVSCDGVEVIREKVNICEVTSYTLR